MTSPTTTLPAAVATYVNGANAFDLDLAMSAFAEDAMVNDARREFWGIDAIRAWAAKEMIGDHVTMDVTRVVERHGELVVDAIVDGDFDKTNLPDPCVLSHYLTVRDDRITRLIIILNTASG